MLYKIYVIKSLLSENSKCYVGSTCQKYLTQRLAVHKYHHKIGLKSTTSHELFELYNKKNCKIFLLAETDAEHVKELEQYFINNLDTVNKNLKNRIIETPLSDYINMNHNLPID
jgi:hypothetical protein